MSCLLSFLHPAPPLQGKPTAAKRHEEEEEETARNREGYNYKYGLSSSSSSSFNRVEAARAAAEAEAAEPYVPLMPAWRQRQVARGADREHLRNLKLELTTVEDQVSHDIVKVGGGGVQALLRTVIENACSKLVKTRVALGLS